MKNAIEKKIAMDLLKAIEKKIKDKSPTGLKHQQVKSG